MPVKAELSWKNTRVCLNFTCECGAHGHIDTFFAYVIMCAACGRKYGLNPAVELITIENAYNRWLNNSADEIEDDYTMAVTYWKDDPKLVNPNCPTCDDPNVYWREILVSVNDTKINELKYQLVCRNGHTILGWPDPQPEWLTNEIIENGQSI